MDWFVCVLAGGFFTLIFFVPSLLFTCSKENIAGLVTGALDFVSAIVMSFGWADALWMSGKVDWYLFGVYNYPVLGWFCITMLIGGVLFITLNIRGIMKRKETSTSAAQA